VTRETLHYVGVDPFSYHKIYAVNPWVVVSGDWWPADRVASGIAVNVPEAWTYTTPGTD
jgi:hypothetical protein